MARQTKSREAKVIQALSHPIRISVLMEMHMRGTLSASKHARAIDERINNVNYHFRRLKEAGLIQLKDQVRRRGGLENLFELVPGTPVFLLLDFASYLLTSQNETAKAAPNAERAVELLPLEVDDQGLSQVRSLVAGATEEAKRLAFEAQGRLQRGGEKGKRFDLGLGVFPRPSAEIGRAAGHNEDAGERRAA